MPNPSSSPSSFALSSLILASLDIGFVDALRLVPAPPPLRLRPLRLQLGCESPSAPGVTRLLFEGEFGLTAYGAGRGLVVTHVLPNGHAFRLGVQVRGPTGGKAEEGEHAKTHG